MNEKKLDMDDEVNQIQMKKILGAVEKMRINSIINEIMNGVTKALTKECDE